MSNPFKNMPIPTPIRTQHHVTSVNKDIGNKNIPVNVNVNVNTHAEFKTGTVATASSDSS